MLCFVGLGLRAEYNPLAKNGSVGLFYRKPIARNQDRFHEFLQDIALRKRANKAEMRQDLVSRAIAENAKAKRFRFAYLGIKRTDYFRDAEFGLEGFISDSNVSSIIVPQTPPRIIYKVGNEIFLGLATRKPWAYEITYSDLGRKTAHFKQGDRFTLDDEPYQFSTDTTLTAGGSGFGLFAKYDFFQYKKISSYMKAGGVLITSLNATIDGGFAREASCYGGMERYYDSSQQRYRYRIIYFPCLEHSLIYGAYATGNGNADNDFRVSTLLGIEYQLFNRSNIALRAEYSPFTKSIEAELMVKKDIVRNDYAGNQYGKENANGFQSDYVGVSLVNDYFYNTQFKLESIDIFRVNNQKHIIVPQTPPTITNKPGKSLFFGFLINKRLSYEFILNNFGQKTYHFNKGDKFTLDRQEYQFIQESSFMIKGVGAGVYWKYDYLQYKGFSAYAKIGSYKQFLDGDVQGAYGYRFCEMPFPSSTRRYCYTASRVLAPFLTEATGNGKTKLARENIPAGFEYSFWKGLTLRAEYNPITKNTDIGLMYKKPIAYNQYR